jgi:catechol-2,3-dioxygenase
MDVVQRGDTHILKHIMFLAELALVVNDLPKMKAFYRDVVGLEVYSEDIENLVFLKITDGVEGHPQILGMFDRSSAASQEHTTLDHFAFGIDLADYESEKARLEGHGVAVFPKEFPHFHWRSLFFYDPEGNTVELVAYDPSVVSSP